MPTTDYIWEVTTPDTNLHKLKDAESMHYRGTLGTGGDITVLPTASASNKGDTYKVITDGTYAGQEAKAGDLFISDGSSWILISGSGGSGEDTWRNIKVNGAEKLGTADTTGAVDFVNGTNTTVSFDTTGNKIKIDAVDTTYEEATTSASGLMSASDKTKLNGIATGAEVNQNAFSNVKVDSTTIAADSKTDTLELVAGSNVTITPDATNDKITIAATDTKYTAATAAPGNIASSGAVGTSTNYARQDHTHGISVATGDSNGQVKIAGQNASVKGLAAAAYKGVATTVTSGGTDLVTAGAVYTAIDNLPEPMVFKGSLGTGGTVTALPVDGTATIGDTYKVITAGTYASQAAKVGDTFICDSKTSLLNTWVLIPSGDEPSGTVTNVAISNGGGLSVSGSPITTSGTITISHADTSSQASVSNSGRTYIQSVTLDTYGHVTKLTSATETVTNTDRYVNSASFAHDSTNNNVKMTLTRAGSDTATVTGNIPLVSSSTAGVAPKGAAVSSQSQSTKFLREDGTWAAPSYTTDTNTHRPIQVNGTEILGNNTTALNLKAGSNVTLSNNGGTVTINSSYSNTDTKVTQTATSTSAAYEVLFSETADNTTRTEAARKNSNLLFNPNIGVLYGTSEVRSTILSVSSTNGTNGGISLYGQASNVDNYGIYFRQTSNKEKHGYVQGDWATYFTMNDQDNRGWVFRRNKTTGNVASIDTKGNVVANGSVTVGGNAANTSGCRMVYDSTNECMNLEFAS